MESRRIGPYELLDPLGEGGMGTVYRARDTRLGRIVAIKFIRTLAEDRQRQLRFLREAKVEAALSHPNIATILDVGEAPPGSDSSASGPTPYLVLEFVPGRDLESLAREGPLAAGELLRIARQIAAGLQSAHEAGVVHRDLKPSNIRVTPNGLVKILDFGLARFEPGAGPTSDSIREFETNEGSVLGTLPYMAPEQAAGQAIDARADLFAFGVLLYELGCGRLPFRGATPLERLRAVLGDEPPPLAPQASHLPQRFVALVHRLLEKNPARRYQSAREVEQEIDAVARGLSEAATSAGLPDGEAWSRSPAPSAANPPAHPRRHRLVALLAIAALAAGLAGYLYDRRGGAQAERLLAQGRAAEQLTDPQAARIAAGLFEQATRLRPKLVEAWAELSRALADAYAREGLPALLERADRAANRAFEIEPDSIFAHIARARMERLHGDADAAIASLESIPRQRTALGVVERELADAWEQKGDSAKAEEQLLAAVSAAPESWENWNALGRFRVTHGNLPGARAAFEKARDLAPAEITIPQENIASVLAMQGKFEEALAAYEKISSPVADSSSASNMGTLHYMNGEFAAAVSDFERAIQIDPRNAGYHRNLADTLLRMGRADEARPEYDRALRLVDAQLEQTPKDADLQLARALYLARSGSCEEAVRYADVLATKLAPTAATSHALARPFALCGAPSRAIQQLREAVAAGFSAANLASEDELAALRGDPEFERLAGSPH